MTDKTITDAHDIQDPLPEANWLWRRVFTFLALVVVFGILIGLAFATNRIVGNVVGRIDTMNAAAVADIALRALSVIETMFRLMFWALLVVVTYYMVAPSAEQITKMLQTARLLKAGVQIASRTVETPDRRDSAATIGQPPQPATPPVERDEGQIGDQMAPELGGNGGRGDEMDLWATRVAEDPETRSTGLPADMPPISVPDKDN
jgi:cation transport ATPase